MLKNFFYSLFLIVFLFSYPSLKIAQADGFVISLYFDKNTAILSFDKNSTQNIVVDKNISPSIQEFVVNETSGNYILKYDDGNSSEIASVEFNAEDGPFKLTTPYFSLAKNLKISEKSSEKEILSADLSTFSTCNGNGICEVEKRETAQNCIGDCGNKQNVYSEQTKKILFESDGKIIDPETKEIVLQDPLFFKVVPSSQKNPQTKKKFSVFAPIAFFLLLFLLIYIVYKKRKKFNR